MRVIERDHFVEDNLFVGSEKTKLLFFNFLLLQNCKTKQGLRNRSLRFEKFKQLSDCLVFL